MGAYRCGGNFDPRASYYYASECVFCVKVSPQFAMIKQVPMHTIGDTGASAPYQETEMNVFSREL